jgi:hypothetical protein
MQSVAMHINILMSSAAFGIFFWSRWAFSRYCAFMPYWYFYGYLLPCTSFWYTCKAVLLCWRLAMEKLHSGHTALLNLFTECKYEFGIPISQCLYATVEKILRGRLDSIIWDWNHGIHLAFQESTCLAAIELEMEFVWEFHRIHPMRNLNYSWYPHHSSRFH